MAKSIRGVRLLIDRLFNDSFTHRLTNTQETLTFKVNKPSKSKHRPFDEYIINKDTTRNTTLLYVKTEEPLPELLASFSTDELSEVNLDEFSLSTIKRLALSTDKSRLDNVFIHAFEMMVRFARTPYRAPSWTITGGPGQYQRLEVTLPLLDTEIKLNIYRHEMRYWLIAMIPATEYGNCIYGNPRTGGDAYQEFIDELDEVLLRFGYKLDDRRDLLRRVHAFKEEMATIFDTLK